MTQGTFPVHIHAQPDAVWPWVVDLTKHAAWSPKNYEVEKMSGETGQVGARYRSVGWIPGDSHHENDVEITKVDPNRRLEFIAHEDAGDYANSFDLASRDGGTDVVYQLVFPKMTGMNGLVVPILFPLVGKPQIRKRMKMLKTAVEGPSDV
jgi:uncharacterized protein YndB with AHSA1/START domain